MIKTANRSKNKGLSIIAVVLMSAVVFGLQGCGGSSGGGENSFTVNTSIEINGTISPSSVTANLNEIASFTITPNSGYLIDSVTGCGGVLSTNTYATGAIDSDCTVTVNFIVQTVNPVSALYTSATSWNDYIRGDEWFAAPDIACDAVNDTACTHGGELRIVETAGKLTCDGLSAADDLGAFTWVCDDSTGSARMLSTDLSKGKNLSDLIDFSASSFKPNAVTVYHNGAIWATTPSSIWWSNPVEVSNYGGVLANASTIYLVTNSSASTYILAADKTGFVVQPGVTLTGPGTDVSIITASSKKYIWLEGSVDATGDRNGVYTISINFSTFRNLRVSNATREGLSLGWTSNSKITNVTANNNGFSGIVVSSSTLSNNSLSDLYTYNNTYSGVTCSGCMNSSLSNVTAVNNESHGLYIVGGFNNMIWDVSISSNDSHGVYVSHSSNNMLSNLTSSNNRTYGVIIENSNNNTLQGVTVANNNYAGVIVFGNNNALSSVAAANNGGLVNDVSAAGLQITESSNNLFSNLAVANNTYYGLSLFNASNNTFTGLLRVGNNSTNCYVSGGVAPGLVDTTCAIDGTSDFSLATDVTMANSFVGKVTTNDVQNASDISGIADYPATPAVFDWGGFDNINRSWGNDGSVFPSLDQQNRWLSGTGRIWDWSVSSADSGNSGNPALLRVVSLPTGNDTYTQLWSVSPPSNDNLGCETAKPGSVWNGSTCVSTYLHGAVEIQSDNIGNNNILCETGETCLYMPNIGSYQGHGDLVSAGTFVDGTLTGITLLKYANNGR